MKVIIFLTMTYCQSLNGFTTGKCFLIQILANWPKKCYFQKKKKRKKKKVQIHPILSLNNIQVERAFYQNHLGILLMKQHIDSAILKINTGMSVIKKLRHSLPRKSVVTNYKAFLRPLIDYGDIYDQPQNECFC